MKTKNIFKTLALAMLMPTMLLTTACSSEDDVVNNTANTENTINKGYALPVTVNVTREGGDATRATYNESTKKLEFSTGDKLFVYGSATEAGSFAGTLDYVPATGKFSGTIYTQEQWTGTADALFTAASAVANLTATLLPNGYDANGSNSFLSINNNSTTDIAYDDRLTVSYSKAFVASETAKATGVEQLSLERTSTYSSGFELAPLNAILNFTISGLEAGAKNVSLQLSGFDNTVTGSVTPNASGVATFAIGVSGGSKIKEESNNLTVGSSNLTLPGGTALAAGKIYNIARSALITSPAVGQVIGDNGKNYANAAAAEADGATAVAKIFYVGSDNGEAAPYNHGLALALSDVSSTQTWCSQTSNTCLTTQYSSSSDAKGDMAGLANTDALVGHGSHTHAAANAARNYNSGTHPTGTSAWFLPSAGQWDKMATAASGYNNLGLQSDYYYWSSSESRADYAWSFNPDNGKWILNDKYYGFLVRACLAF